MGAHQAGGAPSRRRSTTWLAAHERDDDVRVGFDLQAIAEVADAVARHGERYLERVFTVRERDEAARGRFRGPTWLAARFAAKEATMKALDAQDTAIGWHEVEVLTSGANWSLALSGTAEVVRQRSGVGSLLLSVSVAGPVAAAIVVAV